MAIIDSFKANTTSVQVAISLSSFQGFANTLYYSSPGLQI